MSIGAGGIRGASLILALVLGTATVSAQTSSSGTWTDPPARGTAPPTPAAPVRAPESAAAKNEVGKAAEGAAAEGTEAATGPTAIRRTDSPTPSVARHAATPERKRTREANRAHRKLVARAPRVELASRRVVEPPVVVRPMPRRVVARSFAPRLVAAPPYRYGLLPVGRVEGPTDGERDPIFADGDDRTTRIAAARAAGYLVVRTRTVRFPDGRTVRGYRPYEDDDGSD